MISWWLVERRRGRAEVAWGPASAPFAPSRSSALWRDNPDLVSGLDSGRTVVRRGARSAATEPSSEPPEPPRSDNHGSSERQLKRDLTVDIGGWKDTLIPTALDPYTIEGKTYASPVDIGMVGFWLDGIGLAASTAGHAPVDVALLARAAAAGLGAGR